MTDIYQWHDAGDHSPGFICEVELSDGSIIEAYYQYGEWFDRGGSVVHPRRFRPAYHVIYTGLYQAPSEIWRQESNL